VSNDTRIKFMTDGLLLRETMLDPLLSKYSVIMYGTDLRHVLPHFSPALLL
jgi:hypothetical protein